MDDPYGDPNTNLLEHIVLITIVSHFKGVLGLWDLIDLSSDLLRVNDFTTYEVKGRKVLCLPAMSQPSRMYGE